MEEAPVAIGNDDVEALLAAEARAGEDQDGALRTLLGLVLRHHPDGAGQAAELLAAVADRSSPAAIACGVDGSPVADGVEGQVHLALGALALAANQAHAALEALRAAAGESAAWQPVAARLLELALGRTGRWGEVATLLRARSPAGVSSVSSRRAHALRRAGAPSARELWRQLFGAHPDPLTAGPFLDLGLESWDDSERLDRLQHAADWETDPTLRSLLRGWLADGLAASGRQEAAEGVRRRAQADSSDTTRELADGLKRSWSEQDWEGVALALRALAERLGESRRAPQLLALAGRGALERLDDPGRAASWLSEALALSPGDGECAEALCEARVALGETKQAGELHEGPVAHLLGQTPAEDDHLPPACALALAWRDGDRAGLAMACRAWADTLGDGRHAAALLAAAALLETREPAARRDAARAVAACPELLAAHLVRLRVAASAGHSRALLESCQALLEHGLAVDSGWSGTLALTGALAAADLGESAAARTLYERTARALFGATPVPDLQEQLEASGAWDRHRVDLLAAAQRLGLDPAAEPLEPAAPDAQDEDEGDLEGRADTLRAAARWPQLASVLSRLADRPDDERVPEWLRERARILEWRVGALESAADAWEDYVARVPEQRDGYAVLDRLYARLGRSARRRAVLATWLERVPDDDVRLELARVELEAGDPEAAASRLDVMLQDPNADVSVLRLMLEVAEAAGDDETLAAVLETLARRCADPSERSRLYLQAACCYRDRLGGGPVVLENAMLAFMCDRDHEEAFSTLVALYESAERWGEVVGICDLALARARSGGPYSAADLLRRRALVELHRLDKPEDAVETLIEALAAEPSSEETAGLLDTVITATGDLGARRRMWELRARVGDPHARRRALVLAAEAHLLGGDRARACALLDRLRRADPDDAELLRLLADACAADGAWRRLAELRLITAEQDPAEAVRALVSAAELLETHIGDLPGALALRERAATLALDDAEHLDDLARLYEATQRWEALQRVSARQLDLAATDGERARVRCRVGRAREAGSHDKDAAIRAYREALEYDVACAEAYDALRALFVADERWDDALETLEAKAAALDEPSARAQALYEKGELHLEGREDPGAAAEAWRRALAADPDHGPSSRQLLYLLLAREAWAEAAPVARRVVRLAADDGPAERIHTLSLLGRVALAVGEAEEAADAVARALAIDPEDERSLAVLSELVASASAADLSRPVLDALDRALRDADAGDAASIHLLRGRAAETAGDTDIALEHMANAVQADSTLLSARRAWSGLLGRLDRWAEAAEVLGTAAEVDIERASWLTFQLDSADILLDRLDDAEGAVALYEPALARLSPGTAEAHQDDAAPAVARAESGTGLTEALLRRALYGTVQGYRQLGQFEDAILAAERLCRLEASRPVSAHGQSSLGRYYHFLGRLHEEGLEDAAQAEEWYRKAMKAAPTDAVCVSGLARLLARTDADAADAVVQEALGILAREGGLAGAEGQRLLCFRARLREGAGDPQGAADMLLDAASMADDPIVPRRALAALYLRSFDHGVAFALSCYHEMLRSDPAAPDAFRGLISIYERTEQPDKLAWTRALFGLLSPRSPEALSPSSELDPQPGTAGRLDADLIEQHVLHPRARNPIWVLWPVAAQYLARVYPVAPPVDPDGQQLWPAQPDHPASRALSSLATFLSEDFTRELQVWHSPAAAGVTACPSTPPLLRVGGSAVEAGEAALRFRLARVAALLRDGRALALVEEPGVALGAVQSVAALFQVAVGAATDAGAPADLPRMLVRAARAVLAEDTTFGEAEPDVDAFSTGLSRTADRIGLLACDDPRVAVRALLGEDTADPGRCADALRRRPEVSDLVRFALSEEHFVVRRELRRRGA